MTKQDDLAQAEYDRRQSERIANLHRAHGQTEAAEQQDKQTEKFEKEVAGYKRDIEDSREWWK